MEGLNRVVKAGKARYIGISNCFAWQLAKANYYARSQEDQEYVSIQGHYNLIAREEERGMVPFCDSENIAMTPPYSALAGGRLSRHLGETSNRLEQDAYARFKYDATAEKDGKIIWRVEEIAGKRNVSMTEVSLAWLLTKVTAPVVGATKISYVDGAVKAVELELTEDEIRYLEEMYVPYALAGVMAQNGKQNSGRNALGEFVPEFEHYNDDVLFGENWNNQDIDHKTRCMLMLVALMSSAVTDSSLKYHLENAKKEDVSKKRLRQSLPMWRFMLDGRKDVLYLIWQKKCGRRRSLSLMLKWCMLHKCCFRLESQTTGLHSILSDRVILLRFSVHRLVFLM